MDFPYLEHPSAPRRKPVLTPGPGRHTAETQEDRHRAVAPRQSRRPASVFTALLLGGIGASLSLASGPALGTPVLRGEGGRASAGNPRLQMERCGQTGCFPALEPTRASRRVRASTSSQALPGPPAVRTVSFSLQGPAPCTQPRARRCCPRCRSCSDHVSHQAHSWRSGLGCCGHRPGGLPAPRVPGSDPLLVVCGLADSLPGGPTAVLPELAPSTQEAHSPESRLTCAGVSHCWVGRGTQSTGQGRVRTGVSVFCWTDPPRGSFSPSPVPTRRLSQGAPPSTQGLGALLSVCMSGLGTLGCFHGW